MTPRTELLVLKGAISEESQEDQAKIFAAKAELEAIVNNAGDSGYVALALLALEIAVKEEENQ